jgi:hypothetical protein
MEEFVSTCPIGTCSINTWGRFLWEPGEGAFESRDSILELLGIFPIIQEIGLLSGERQETYY